MKLQLKKSLHFVALSVSLSLAATAARAESLADALVSAYNHSGLLEQNRALLRAADEDVAAAGATLQPIVNWAAQAQRSFGNTSTSTGFTSSLSNTNLTLSLTASLLVYDFGGSAASIEAARETVFATRAQLVSIEQRVMLRAVTAYLNVRNASEFVKLRQNNLRLLTQELRAANDRFDVGEVTRTDVALAQARLAQARSGLAGSQGDLLRSREEYANVIGHQPKQLPQLPRLPRIERKVANAKALAVDQSIPFPSDTDALLVFKILIIVLCKFNFSSVKLIFSEISKSFSLLTPLIPLLSFPFSGLYLDQLPSYHSIFGL